jgi:hypothetical protein
VYDRTSIREGMMVRSADGEKLGRVLAVGTTELQVEKGLFFPKDYVARFEDVSDVQGDEVILRHGRDALLSAPRFPVEEAGPAVPAVSARRAAPPPGTATPLQEETARAGGEVRAPLVEEELGKARS